MPAFRPPGPCPVCVEPVPAGRRSCPHCGSSANDGWGTPAEGEGLDLPDDEFNYEEFVEREFGGEGRATRPGRGPRKALLWALVALALAAVFAGAGWFSLQ